MIAHKRNLFAFTVVILALDIAALILMYVTGALDILARLAWIAAGMATLIIPTWLFLIFIALFLVLLWWSLPWNKLEIRLGVCLLAAGLLAGLVLPAWGYSRMMLMEFFQTSHLYFGAEETGIERIDPQEFAVSCAILPGGDAPPGITLTLTNTTTYPRSYTVFLDPPSDWWRHLGETASKTGRVMWVELAPGETWRMSRPLAFWMLISGMIAVAYINNPKGTMADCSWLMAGRQGLVVLGALLVLIGVVCLCAGPYRSRRK